MSPAGAPAGLDWPFTPAVEPDGAPGELHHLAAGSDFSFAFQIQTQLDAPRVETRTPVEVGCAMELVTLEAESAPAKTTGQLPPPGSNTRPSACLGKIR
jgi:hypothetical protein